MTKSEVAISAAIGTSLTVQLIVHADTVALSALPEWMTAVGLIGGPIATVIGIIVGVLHLRERIDTYTHEVNDKMDRLLELTRASAEAAGEIKGELKGRAAVIAEMAAEKAQAALIEKYRTEGADALLKAQQTPPAPTPPPNA